MDRRDWDRLAADFESSVYDIVATDREGVLSRLVARAWGRRSGGVLVDLGCGIGTFVKRFGDRFAAVRALDISPVMLERARDRCAGMRHVEWMCGDLRRAADELAGHADLAVCLNVITSPSAAKRAGMWDAVATVTKPGRCALVVVPALESATLVAEVDDRVHPASSGIVEVEGGTQKYFTREELGDVVGRHGLLALEIVPVSYPWSAEDLAAPRSAKRTPFDWAVLARRRAPAAA